MLSWKKICCAIDFSKSSRDALALAVDLCGTLGAELTLYHVAVLPIYVAADATIMPGPDTVRQLLEDVERNLAEWRVQAEQLGCAKVKTETNFSPDGVGDGIARYAGESGQDVIVIGTHGRTGIKHALLGSVAERVVRKAGCPVITVRPKHG